jgi:hypothetical protein
VGGDIEVHNRPSSLYLSFEHASLEFMYKKMLVPAFPHYINQLRKRPSERNRHRW